MVDKPKGTNIIDSKIVLKLKTDEDRIPYKYKARLVARGFTQRHRIDYEEMFSPVAPIAAIRAVIAMATIYNWELQSTDVNQAFINSELRHTIYMKPPRGSEVPEDKVYKVVRGLYGLKQAGQEWNRELDKFLQAIGFTLAECAPCIYVKGQGQSLVVIATHVDDTLIASPSKEEVLKVKVEMSKKWKIEDNGDV